MNQITFTDLLRDSFARSDFFGNVSVIDILVGLLVTFAVSMFVFYIYQRTYNGALYSHTYNVSLVLMSMITSLIIMTISSNLVLSLGMVGALSIVRFRTAIKDPMDIMFMFWAIAVGLSCGASLYMIAIVGSLFIGVILLLLMRYRNTNNAYMLIIHYTAEANDEVQKIISALDYQIKAKSATGGLTELTIEVNLIGADTKFIDELSGIYGVQDATLISYSGQFTE